MNDIKQILKTKFPGTIAEAKQLFKYITVDPERAINRKRNDLIDTFAEELLKFLEE